MIPEGLAAVLPIAVGIAVVPLPMMATVLMLTSARGRGAAAGFVAGWLLGVTVSLLLFVQLGSLLSEPTEGPRPVVGVIQLLLAIGLGVLAVRSWRSVAAPGEAALPAWMSALDSMSPVRAFGLGAALAALNPKNLMLSLSAGVALADLALDGSALAVTTVVYVLVASATVAGPFLLHLVARERVTGALDALRGWLAANNQVVMAVLLTVLAVIVLAKALSAFG